MRSRRTTEQLALPWTGRMEWVEVPRETRAAVTTLLGLLLRAAAVRDEAVLEAGDGDADV